MELNHLKYFYHVVRQGGFTRASEVLRVAQPAISKTVKNLEDQIGSPLLERTARGIHLTKIGRTVFEHCERVFIELDNLKAAVSADSAQCKGPVEIAASEPIASWIVPHVLHPFKKDHPESLPSLYSAPAKNLFEMIENGKLEFGLFFHIPELTDSLKSERVALLPFELVIAADAAKDAKVRASFIGSREVDDVTTRRFPTIERMRKKWPEVSIQISSNNLTAHKELVRKGAGVSILPAFMVEEELKNGTFKRVMPGEEFIFDLKLITRKRGVLSRESTTFLGYLKEWLKTVEA